MCKYPGECEGRSPSRLASRAASADVVRRLLLRDARRRERAAFGRDSHFRFRAPLQFTGSGSGKPLKKVDQRSIKKRDHAHQQLVEEGLEAVLSRKQRATPPVARIFDGEKEAKLIALACSKPPKGRARWTLRMLEKKVVELEIVDRASDSTIGRVLKKTFSSPIASSNGSSRRRPTARL